MKWWVQIRNVKWSVCLKNAKGNDVFGSQMQREIVCLAQARNSKWSVWRNIAIWYEMFGSRTQQELKW